MAPKFTDEDRRRRLAQRHRLTIDARIDDPVTITDDLVALHSSDPATVFLSALARMDNPDIAAVEAALYRDRSLVRHHAMRRTIWVMAREVARLAHGAATAKIARAERKRTVAAMADSTDIADPNAWLDDAIAETVAILAENGPTTTRSIGEALPHLVVPVIFGVGTKNPASLNAHTKVLQLAGFEATLVRAAPVGSWLSAEYLWAPTTEWLDQHLAGMAEVEAAGPLLDRWLRRFGPATQTDMQWWFGWTKTLLGKSLDAIGAEPVELESGDMAYVALGDAELQQDPGPWVQLLPGLDPTVMGWKERDWYLDPAHVDRLFDRFGNAGPTVWADGRVVGGWVQQPNGDIAVELTESLGTDHPRLLDDAIERLRASVGDTVVRPRFPAPAQKDLFTA